MAKIKENRKSGSLPRRNTPRAKAGRWKLEVNIWKGSRMEGASDFSQIVHLSAGDPKQAKFKALQSISRQVYVADEFLDCDGKLRVNADLHYASINGNGIYPNAFSLRPHSTYYSVCRAKRPSCVFVIKKNGHDS
jgi:hypothetical protein